MKIMHTWEYGLRCILKIAKNYHKRSVTIPEIAKNEGLSVAYVGKLMNLLLKKGLVKSMRGCLGGYILSLDPADISVYDIFLALGESRFQFEDCQNYTGNLDECVHVINNDCLVLPLWKKLDRTLKEALLSVSLKDVMNGMALDHDTANSVTLVG